MSILHRLPYDVLEQIAALMDKKSLRKAALASRALNEIVTRFLYSSVVFNKPVQNPYRLSSRVRIVGPFGAFDRRPLLRNAVRVVVLCTRFAKPARPTWSETHNLERCSKNLALLRNLDVIYVTESLNKEECEHYFGIISKMPSLRRLVVMGQLALTVMGTLPNVKTFEFTCPPGLISDFDFAKLSPRVRRLNTQRSAELSRCHINSFKSLESLVLGDAVAHPAMEICKLVEDLHSLRQLSFACDLVSSIPVFFHSIGRGGHHRGRGYYRGFRGGRIISLERDRPISLVPSVLSHLIDLRIKIRPQKLPGGGQKLYTLIRSIAGFSQLKRLDISSSLYPPMFLECNELLDHIASTHGPTLETLRIPILKPNARNLHNIIAGSKGLRELWFFVNQNLKSRIPEQIRVSTSLEIIRFYGSGSWVYGFAGALLQQTSSSLREVQAYEAHSVNWGDHLDWKVLWEYDEIECRPKRSIHGPLESTLELKHKVNNASMQRRSIRASDFFELADESDPDLDMPILDRPCIWESLPVHYEWYTPTRSPEPAHPADLPSDNDDDDDTWMTIYEDRKGRRSKRAFIRY